MSALNQCTKVLLQRIAAAAGEPDRIGHRHTSMLARKFDDRQRQFRQRGKDQLFALELGAQAPNLLAEGAKKGANVPSAH